MPPLKALPRLEILSERNPPTITLTNGVLSAVGTGDDDEIVFVLLDPDTIQVSISSTGETESFPLADVTSLRAQGLDGNDTITVATEITLPATLEGGPGDDTIRGGGGDDTIRGGAGQNTLDGGPGDNDIRDGADDTPVTPTDPDEPTDPEDPPSTNPLDGTGSYNPTVAPDMPPFWLNNPRFDPCGPGDGPPDHLFNRPVVEQPTTPDGKPIRGSRNAPAEDGRRFNRNGDAGPTTTEAEEPTVSGDRGGTGGGAGGGGAGANVLRVSPPSPPARFV
jgi:Ca2+-binding RTX toxin-like protein